MGHWEAGGNTISLKKNDTHGQAKEAEEAEEVICIDNFVNWYKRVEFKDSSTKL
jgi:hypothetical protein